jgi:hypothetical protein
MQQSFMFDRIGQPQARQPGLLRSKDVPTASQTKILIGDHKPIVAIAQ